MAFCLHNWSKEDNQRKFAISINYWRIVVLYAPNQSLTTVLHGSFLIFSLPFLHCKQILVVCLWFHVHGWIQLLIAIYSLPRVAVHFPYLTSLLTLNSWHHIVGYNITWQDNWYYQLPKRLSLVLIKKIDLGSSWLFSFSHPIVFNVLVWWYQINSQNMWSS